MKFRHYLDEDLANGDATSDAILGDEKAVGVIKAKEDCVLAGLEEARKMFMLLKLRTKSGLKDGDRVKKGQEVLRVDGKAKDILKVERTALNFMMRMSGIATATSELVQKCRKVNRSIRIAATRKTTPGFREYEKKAVKIGGGFPHRYDLSDSILIKDNHLNIVGSIRESLARARKTKKKIEIEVETIKDALLAAKEAPDMIMLDNMRPKEVKEAYGKIKAIS
ncbi:MAG: carboxylating nicotinate-nucleotide diphosphorylase, partial [Thermoplasmata archaeon]|nr:carboxylating nicotinate-nucleotide diphosphorylase [Thermoplasmata archaeon]